MEIMPKRNVYDAFQNVSIPYQELRNLRHRRYYAHDKDRHIMNSQHCEKGWSAEDMVLSYMKNCHDIHLSHYPENDIRN